jgi:tRNA-uridine 2-sulfurtransferase
MRIAVAMSGGVDSSTVAAILKHTGYDLVGFSMQLWNQRRINVGPDGEPLPSRCCSLDDIYDARTVANQLQFPFYVVNLEDSFEQNVVAPFVEAYLTGRTPSPCVGCNSHLKFAKLVELAAAVGSEKVATGHYARVEATASGYRLRQGKDRQKDQSYFLFELTQQQLAHALFPLGELTKAEVRALARQHGLMVAEKGESQEICFVPDGDYARFIERYLQENRADTAATYATKLHQLQARKKATTGGDIVLLDGQVVGQHQGIHHYTIGQRRGLGIAWSEPLYVINIDPQTNQVVVGPQTALPGSSLKVNQVNWISGQAPAQSFSAAVRIRYRHQEAPAKIIPQAADQVIVEFETPQRAISPGQAAVFYDGEYVLGGGWIA